MYKEHMEMQIKEIILNNCREIPEPTNELKKKTVKEALYTPSRFVFNELQFDTMSLELIHYINQNHGDARKTKGY